MNLQILSKLFPQSSEAKVDDAVTTEIKIVAGVAAGAFTAHLAHSPALQNMVNFFHLGSDEISAVCGLAAAYATAWACSFVHVHFFNGSVDTVTKSEEK